MKRFHSLFTIVLLLAASFVARAQMSTLKEAYKPYFSVGVAVNLRNISDPEQIALIKRNFNSMTAENVMKPQLVQPHQGEFYWDDADKVANFCRENGIKLRGHCLMWYKQIGDWFFKDENGNYVSREVLYDRMKEKVSGLRTDLTDGLKIFFDDGWVLLRASGTEPSFRIFSESKDKEKAESRAEEYVSMAEEFLSS